MTKIFNTKLYILEEMTQEELNELALERNTLQQRISKAIEYIKNNTMYFDSEYAKDYGELCPIAGAGDTRIHCVIGDKELLEILEGSNNE